MGQCYNSELRNKLTLFGLRRIGNNQWISKETASKYELIFTEENDQKIVTGVDLIEKDGRVHLNVYEEPQPEQPLAQVPEINVHHKTLMAMQRQMEISESYYELLYRWNEEIEMGTGLGNQLRAIAKKNQINYWDFMFLPDPLATGRYLFAAIHEGKAASIHSWMDMPDGRFIVPTDGTPDGAFDSLQCGLEFHAFESQQFETAAAAGQYAIKMLNASKTTYATAIKKLLGKENGSITRNDFYRNSSGEMARIEVLENERGLVFNDVPVMPVVADCIDSLLAPYIKSRILSSQPW